MVTINLRDFYKELYATDFFVEVSEEVASALSQLKVKDENYVRNRARRNKRRGHFSLDESTDLEASACIREPKVEEIAEENIRAEMVHKAISTLPEIQARRIVFHHIVGLSITEIAWMEGISRTSITRSIQLAQKNLKKFLERG